MRPNDRAPNAITLALIVLLALALGPRVAVPLPRTQTGHDPRSAVGQDPLVPRLPAPVRTLDR
jgi:hypothetical protein